MASTSSPVLLAYRDMRNYDMELQAIREKLHSLRTESANDIGMPPWAGSKIEQIPTKVGSQRSLRTSPPKEAKVRSSAVAIKTLKHRSQSQTYETFHRCFDESSSGANTSDANPSRLDSNSSSQNSSSRHRADDLIDRELPQLAMLVSSINKRSQQQASELLSLKRSAQQIVFSHRRRGTRAHPQLDIISHFIEHSSTASIPKIEVDRNGKLQLGHLNVNLNQAETEAIDNAAILRQQLSPTVPLSEPTTSDSTLRDYFKPSQSTGTETPSNRSNSAFKTEDSGFERDQKVSKPAPHQTKRVTKSKKRLLVNLGQAIRKQRKKKAPITKTQLTKTLPVAQRSPDIEVRSSFSWLDATIWSASAAILRVFLNTLVLNYPGFEMPLLLVLVGTISYSVYRAVLSQSKNMNATYRTGSVLFGLLLGSVL